MSSAPAAAASLDERARLAVLGAVLLALFLSSLHQTIVGTALPRIITDFIATASTPGL